ncbi:MAG: lipoprotein [Flammeovirgaceae bacterium]
MKKILSILSLAAVLAACSTPKYAAHFPSSSVETGYHKVTVASAETQQATPNGQPAEMLTASVAAAPVATTTAEVQKQVKAAFQKLSKEEKKEVRQLLKKEIKALAKSGKKEASVSATTARGGMDHDLKLAAIFGAVGLVGLLIGGNVFTVIGAIAMIIGVVFFVKWLMRQ